MNGTVKFALRNKCNADIDYKISHWYITYAVDPCFDGDRFVSTFTNTHSEIVNFLNHWNEVPTSTCGNIKKYVYYLFGCSSVQVRAITDEYF